MKHQILLSLSCLVLIAPILCAEPARLASGPEVSTTAGGVKIAFAVTALTDVDVAIIGGEGKVIRHLAAGRLGANAPAPLRKNALRQTLTWDRTDDAGGAVAADALRVRVRVGMGAKLHKILGGSPQKMTGGVGLAVGPEGTLYVMRSGGLYAHRMTVTIMAHDGDGKYLRQIFPGPANLPAAKRSGWPRVKLNDGREVPVLFHLLTRTTYPGAFFSSRSFPVVTKDGRLIVLGAGATGSTVKHADLRGGRRLLILGTDASVPANFLGPIVADESYDGFGHIALSPDEKHVYVSGLFIRKRGTANVVWKVPLDGSAPASVFLGEAFVSGTGASLNDPRGVAVDGEGNVYVADYGNHRIAVFSPAGKLLDELPVQFPDTVRVHRKTGRLYVVSLAEQKFGSDKSAYFSTGQNWMATKVVAFASRGSTDPAATLEIASLLRGGKLPRYGGGGMMALDDSTQESVLWLTGVAYGDSRVLKVVDRGGKLESLGTPIRDLGKKEPGIGLPNVGDAGVLGDRVLTNYPGFGSHRSPSAPTFDAVTGEYKGKYTFYQNVGKKPENVWSLIYGEMTPGMDGKFYVQETDILRRYDARGMPVPFKTAGKHFMPGFPFDRHTRNSTLFVRPDGTIYLTCREEAEGSGQALDKAVVVVRVVNPDGSVKADPIRVQGARLGGLTVDSKGHLYLGALVRKRTDPSIPAEFAGKLPANSKHGFPGVTYKQTGAIVKFPPSGGSLLIDPKGGYVAGRQRKSRVALTGGRILTRVGLLQEKHAAGCNCETTRFDIDRFDRLYVPDPFRFCVQVLDSEGNQITRFGDYGNMDDRGGANGPKIPLGWPLTTAVADGRVWIADLVNRRVVGVKLTWADQRTAAVR